MKKNIVILLIVVIVFGMYYIILNKNILKNTVNSITMNNIDDSQNKSKTIVSVKNNINNNSSSDSTEITQDWKLILVNTDNKLPDNYEIKLDKIEDKEIDYRIKNSLEQMINDAKKENLNIWIQSAYRSIERQEELFNKKVQEYLDYGETPEVAEELTLMTINKPRTSEHNLGLSVDFNTVKTDFDNSDEFIWLEKNAENYGFILRYRKDKENITKVIYEPWHWRYVGIENAKAINKLDMCLEEYINYLQK